MFSLNTFISIFILYLISFVHSNVLANSNIALRLSDLKGSDPYQYRKELNDLLQSPNPNDLIAFFKDLKDYDYLNSKIVEDIIFIFEINPSIIHPTNLPKFLSTFDIALSEGARYTDVKKLEDISIKLRTELVAIQDKLKLSDNEKLEYMLNEDENDNTNFYHPSNLLLLDSNNEKLFKMYLDEMLSQDNIYLLSLGFQEMLLGRTDLLQNVLRYNPEEIQKNLNSICTLFQQSSFYNSTPSSNKISQEELKSFLDEISKMLENNTPNKIDAIVCQDDNKNIKELFLKIFNPKTDSNLGRENKTDTDKTEKIEVITIDNIKLKVQYVQSKECSLEQNNNFFINNNYNAINFSITMYKKLSATERNTAIINTSRSSSEICHHEINIKYLN